MQISFTEKKNIRKNFGKLKESLSIPNLIEVQKNSYKELTEFNKIELELTKGFSKMKLEKQNIHNDVFAEVEKVAYEIQNKL